MIVTAFVVAIMILEGLCQHDGGNWGYHSGMSFISPDHWKDLPGTSCGGQRQSPINIVKRHAVYSNKLKPVSISGEKQKVNVFLQSSATSLYLNFKDQWTISFRGEGCFRPIVIHWHWGSKNNQGSEHRIDGVQYDMEGHVVTYNCNLYNNSNDAMHSVNGLYVFSILYRVGDMNPALGKIVPHMDVIINNKKTLIREMSPADFFPQNRATYYRYQGSLTTPPCTENVIWTVFSDIQSLSENQIFKFRSLQFGAPEKGAMTDNFRPVIPLEVSSGNLKRIVHTSINRSKRFTYNLCIVYILSFFTSTF